ncbi:MAG: uroporphyrinogen decarboxylase family protein [Chloroflexota bacterium]|nr:uroporphyrinogen decarboxylase family protein [Chloroflexota bacterium]
MSAQRGSSLLSMGAVAEVEFDPTDPRTWFMIQHRENQGLDRIEITAQFHDHSMTLAGIPASKFYYDARTTVNVMAAVAAYYGFDSGRASFDIYNIEAEAMGAKMIYADNAMPTIDFRAPLVKGPDDLAKLKPPDWLTTARAPYALDVTKLNTRMGANRGLFCAPFSLAVGVRSYPKLIRDMKRDPKFAHEIFTRLVDDVLPSYLQTQKDYCGVTMALGADAWSAFPNVPPEMHEEWVVPYAMRLFQNCQSFGVMALTVAAADYCEERIERFDKQILFNLLDIQSKLFGGTPTFFLGMGRLVDLPLEPLVEYLDAYKEKDVQASLTAGINARLLRDGPVEKIVESVKRYIDVLGRDHNLSVWLANIPADAPPEHIHAAVAATHTYGQRPIAENLDEIEVQVPERESFQEYADKMSEGAGLGI